MNHENPFFEGAIIFTTSKKAVTFINSPEFSNDILLHIEPQMWDQNAQETLEVSSLGS